MSDKPSDSPVDLDHIRELIDLLIEKEVTELVVEREGMKVKIRRGATEVIMPAAAVQQVVGAAPAGTPVAEEATEESGYEDCFIVTSPMVGTFYRAPEPDADSFVELGSQVDEGHTLCIIEAMKLMNEIVAEAGGEIAAVFVDNAEPVEFGQRLFAIRTRG